MISMQKILVKFAEEDKTYDALCRSWADFHRKAMKISKINDSNARYKAINFLFDEYKSNIPVDLEEVFEYVSQCRSNVNT